MRPTQDTFRNLHAFLAYPEREFTAKAFAKATGVPIATTYRYLRDLEKYHMIEKAGKILIARNINLEFPVARWCVVWRRKVEIKMLPEPETSISRAPV